MANRFNFKTRRYFGFMHPLLTWEYHCFGYRKAGNESETVHDGYEASTTWDDHIRLEEKTHIVRYANFKRHEEYPTNALFVILELLMTVVSFLRVSFGKYLILGWFLGSVVFADAGLSGLGSILGQIALALYIGSIVIALLGSVVRSSSGFDQKIDDICEENGWKKWSEYSDD